MKRIINGKTYNTQTATEIAHYSNGLGGGDFRNFSESLYVTQQGAYFLAGEGGPMTRYARSCGNMTSGSEGIEHVSKREALLWCEEYDFTGEIEEYFSDMIEDA